MSRPILMSHRAAHAAPLAGSFIDIKAPRWRSANSASLFSADRAWVNVTSGGLVLIALEHMGVRSAQVSALDEVVAFVNWRRPEKGQPPVVALAYAGT